MIGSNRLKWSQWRQPRAARRKAITGDQFEVVVEARNGTTAVRLRGELDLATVPLVERCIESVAEENGGEIVFDLADLSFIDASGIDALISAETCLEKRGSHLVLSSCSSQFRRVLSMTGLDDHFRTR